ncbi:MAG TPA: hypothetical protein VEC06_06515, partial [Paucimonas sp.]|nr:hypothetical protein [Paucimonas sp.]
SSASAALEAPHAKMGSAGSGVVESAINHRHAVGGLIDLCDNYLDARRSLPSRIFLNPIGLAIDKRGEGWYFSHGGSNWDYRAWMIGHVRKGYGAVIMTNGDNGMALMNQIADRIERAYGWDSLEKPIPR